MNTDNTSVQTPPAAPQSHRQDVNDRTRLTIVFLALVLLNLLVAIATQWHHMRRSIDGSPLEMIDYPSLQLFWLISAITTTLAGVFVGADWAKRLAGVVLVALTYVAPDNASLKNAAQEWVHTPLRPVANRHKFILRVTTVLLCCEIVVLSSRTGGIASSPFPQFSVTFLVLGMLLTDALLGRSLLALLAVATILTDYLLSASVGVTQFTMQPRCFFAFAFVNLLLQLAVGLAGATKLRNTR